ncbi:cysteine methyltransferase [Pseudoalteromonas porphyrae]|uniref:Methylated-DNA--protein-cysteine methyltransferase n=1 Tax=Pseudoalteromonas porphyrae TaxID=187330 RepID=A0A0N1EPT8_9GAMM|nr:MULTISPECIES: methylated-DNA--[protein]-cysteine S-methyltransferase [Pseudoalteromonas]KPH65270.1 cysteine methyltransferase [Pseudoalteromonas porphyrae]KPH92805.1 cysteine methyltransferase [Pseudoalteromonas porphyrae]NMR27275.1 methylated-DNA--[protein]-cysteine S-methyltransferase [Pseudoalteromonas sp. NEC-BIFX-2020_015]
MFVDYIDTPLGCVEFKASDKGITQVIFSGEIKTHVIASDITTECKKQLHEYFAKARKEFDLPLDPKGTDFQKSVWYCLSNIPYGEVVTYLDIAKMVNKPKGSQAVGGANGRNPISLIVPCHRVIGSNGSLTGYAGGIERKLWLLSHEGFEVKPSKESQQLDIQNVIHSRQAKTEFLA